MRQMATSGGARSHKRRVQGGVREKVAKKTPHQRKQSSSWSPNAIIFVSILGFGMLPGVIAGHYDFEDAHIDLLKLAQFAGARLIHEEAIGLNLSDKTVLCLARPPLSYDVLSIDIGVTPVLSVPGSNVNAVAVKPIAKLVNRWEQLKLRIVDAKRALQIGVVGGGAAGVELILSVQHAVKKFLESLRKSSENILGISQKIR